MTPEPASVPANGSSASVTIGRSSSSKSTEVSKAPGYEPMTSAEESDSSVDWDTFDTSETSPE